MRPRIGLVGSVLRANVRAYAALGAPVAAVVKSNGYGWGAERIVREVDDLVESYVVGDASEFWALRMRTQRPIRLLGNSDPRALAAICASGGIPNVTTSAGLDAAAAHARAIAGPVTIRVGIIDAAGWDGIRAADAGAFAERCNARGLQVELWTHITSEARRADVMASFVACVAAFASAGVAIAGTDIESTAHVRRPQARDRQRIGAGLFGARLGAPVAVRCAIDVAAPVVAWYPPGAIGWAGYGEVRVPANRGVAVLRCGYGDGIPKKLAGDDDILSVGMQYTTRLADNPTREHALIDERTDLDRLAGRLEIDPHELITGLAQHT